MEKLLKKLAHEGGTIVSSSECSELEIAEARCCERMHVTEGGLGFILRPAISKPDFELEKLALKDGDIVLVRYSSSDMSAHDCCRFMEALKLSRAFQNAKHASIIFIEGETDIKTFSEDDMNQAGWFKKGKGRR